MKISTAVRYFFLAVFNAAAFYVIPLAISFESWFLLLIIGLITILINFTYLTERFKALKWITPGFIFLIAFVLFPAGYSFYVSFTNWSTGHILTKQQAIERLEDLSYSLDDQKGVEFDLYVLQDQNLDFYYIADLDDENILFGQAITDDEYDDKYFANHEPSLKNSNGEIVIPQNFYQLSGKEQIANSSQLQDLALLVDKNTRIKLYNISVFGASSGRLSSSQQKYSYDVDTDTLFDNSKNLSCELGFRGNFICGGEIVDPGWRINVGGEKVIPEAVRGVLLNLDFISEVIIYGKKNPISGQLVAADVVLKSEMNDHEVRKLIDIHSRQFLTSAQRPRIVRIVNEIKINSTGKAVMH